MDTCPICKEKFAKYIEPYMNRICPTCLVSYPKTTQIEKGYSICFRNMYHKGGFQAVIEGIDYHRLINVFYMNKIRCIAFEGDDGTIIYTVDKK
jgi:hypothetical protein